MAEQQSRQWVNVSSVVSAYIDENELSEHKRFKLWNIAFSGMDELGLDFFYSVISVPLVVNANHTANIPANSLGVLKVGAFNAAGELVAYQKNARGSTFGSLSNDRLSTLQGYVGDGNVFCNYTDGSDFGNLNCSVCKVGSGSFNIDEKNGIILLNGIENYSYVAIEYIASPEMGGEYRIPIHFKRALMSYIDWRNMPKSEKGSGAWRNMKNDFFNERRLAGRRYKPFDIDGAYKSSLAQTSIPI